MGVSPPSFRRAGAVALALASGAACSLAVDSDGLTGATARPDAALDGPAEGTAPAPDAAGDAAGDATPASDAGRACDASFCDDFDEGVLGARWTGLQQNGGSLSLDPGAAVSAPRSLLVRLPLGPTNRGVSLAKEFPRAGGLRCALSLRVDAPTAASSHVYYAQIRILSPDVSLRVLALGTRPGSSVFEDFTAFPDGGERSNVQQLAPIAAGQWVRVEIETTYSTARVVVDGVPAVAVNIPPSTGTTVAFDLGAAYYSDSAPATLRFDDVVCASL
jgi:hypothetical protein